MSEPGPAPDRPPSPRRRPWLPRWVLPAVVIVAMISAYALLPLKQWLGSAADVIRDLGLAGLALYVAAYIVGTMLFFPAALLSLCAGFAWGAVDGFAVAVSSATLAAITAFTTSRYLFRGRFRTWVMRRPRAAAIDEAVNRRGPWLVFLLRFSPVVPFPFINYALGLAHIPLWQFGLATFFGMMPISFMYTYTGSVARLLGTDTGMTTQQIVFLVIGLVVTAGVTVWVTRAAQKALREASTSTDSAA